MEKVPPLVKFLDVTKDGDELVKMYTKLRIWLQKEGYTSDTAQRISGAPAEIWDIKNRINLKFEKIKKDLINYGIFDNIAFIDYFVDKFTEIDKKYPLKDEE